MDMNIIFKVKDAWDQFGRNHPRFAMFLNAVNQRSVPEGTVIDIKLTYPDGQTMATNFKVTQSDIDLYNSVRLSR